MSRDLAQIQWNHWAHKWEVSAHQIAHKYMRLHGVRIEMMASLMGFEANSIRSENHSEPADFTQAGQLVPILVSKLEIW